MPYTVAPGDNLWNIWLAHGGGMSWTDFKALNAHLGNLDLIYPGNVINLPGDAPAAPPSPGPGAAPAPAPSAPAAPSGPSVPMQIEPGAWLNLQEELMELERQIAEENARIEAERVENEAREMELRLSLSPIDYVAYQSYLRQREAAGQPTYSGAAATDPEMQAMMQGMVGEGGGTLGTGEYGVDIPMTQAISRQEAGDLSPEEMDIIGSFLRAGFEGGEGGYDPTDYWREVEKGFVPTLRQPASTKYSF